MSTIKVTNIQATGETATRAVSGVAAAWSSLDASGGSTATQHGSLNISSVLDNGAGQYGFNFSSNMSGATYSTVGSSNDNAYNNLVTNWPVISNHYTSERTMIGNLRTNTGSYVDSDVCIAVFGDLA